MDEKSIFDKEKYALGKELHVVQSAIDNIGSAVIE